MDEKLCLVYELAIPLRRRDTAQLTSAVRVAPARIVDALTNGTCTEQCQSFEASKFIDQKRISNARKVLHLVHVVVSQS